MAADGIIRVISETIFLSRNKLSVAHLSSYLSKVSVSGTREFSVHLGMRCSAGSCSVYIELSKLTHMLIGFRRFSGFCFS